MSEPGWVIAGRYRVVRRIGTGGMADVLCAHDELLDRDVAVKVFRSVLVGPDGTQDTAKGVERQRAELAALARLNHPNLTTLFDGSIVGQDGPAYLVMELIDGPSLDQAIADGGLGEARTRVVAAQMGDALAYVHSAGMVHRDVKPANILLGDVHGPGLRARLTDFGIVRLVGNESLTQADMTLGSASYLAPEQARGSAVGPPADVYALGLTLIEALTGRRSFDGPALEAVIARLSADPEIPSGLPQPWPGLLRAMTARDPAQRPSAARVAAVLRGSGSVTAPLPSVPVGAFAPAGTYDTAVLPAVAPVAAAAARPPARPAPPVPPAPAHRPPAPRRRWSASLIIAAVLVLALLVAGVALLLASSGGGSGGGSGDTGRQTSGTSSPTHAHPSTSAQRRPSTTPTTSKSAPSTPSTPSSTAPSTTPSSTTPSSTTPSSSVPPTSSSVTRTSTSTSTSPKSSGSSRSRTKSAGSRTSS